MKQAKSTHGVGANHRNSDDIAANCRSECPKCTNRLGCEREKETLGVIGRKDFWGKTVNNEGLLGEKD